MKEKLQSLEAEQDLRPIKLSERALWRMGFCPPFERENAWRSWLYSTTKVPTPTADFGNSSGPHEFDPLPPPRSALYDEIKNGSIAEVAMEIEDPWSDSASLCVHWP
jgi:hypothetical protein